MLAREGRAGVKGDDPDAESVLHRVIDATLAHRKAFHNRRAEPDAPRVVDELVAVYRAHLPPKEQQASFRKVFRSVGHEVPTHLVREFVAADASAWKADRGPRGMAQRFVGQVFGWSPSKVEKLKARRAGDDDPAIFTTLAFDGGTSRTAILKYVLQMLGWSDDEIAEFDRLSTHLDRTR